MKYGVKQVYDARCKMQDPARRHLELSFFFLTQQQLASVHSFIHSINIIPCAQRSPPTSTFQPLFPLCSMACAQSSSASPPLPLYQYPPASHFPPKSNIPHFSPRQWGWRTVRFLTSRSYHCVAPWREEEREFVPKAYQA